MELRLCVRLPLVFAMLLVAAQSHDAQAADERPAYGVLYTAWINPADPWAKVRIRISRKPEWVRWMRFRIDPSRYEQFRGTGEVQIESDAVLWRPPAEDAYLDFQASLDSRRASGAYDAIVTDNWAMFRGDDLVPRIRIDMEDGTQSRAKLDLNLPAGWSAVTPYPRYKSGRFRVDNPRAFFDRPTGWIVVGKIGTRIDDIGPTRVTVAAPIGEGVRRMDMLAFLRWTVPTLQSLFPAFPDRVLIVSAGDPMWRGALSGPRSLFVHADRPMISENATSTLVHEMVHVAMSARNAPGSDWIVEGLAEYYSLETLRRSGTISSARFEKAHRDLAAWGAQAGALDVPRSSGATTARAVGVLRGVDAEIRSLSDGKSSLDEVVRLLAAEAAPVSLDRFRALATSVAGRPLRTLENL